MGKSKSGGAQRTDRASTRTVSKRVEEIQQTKLRPNTTEAETSREIRTRLGISENKFNQLLDYHIARGELKVDRQMRVNRSGFDHSEIVYWIEPNMDFG